MALTGINLSLFIIITNWCLMLLAYRALANKDGGIHDPMNPMDLFVPLCLLLKHFRARSLQPNLVCRIDSLLLFSVEILTSIKRGGV